MRKQLYLDIKNRLKTVQDGEGEQLFKHFDLWNKQVEFIEQETPFACPAVFVEFAPIAWRTQGNDVQDGDINVHLHIVTEWHAGTADYSPTEEQALDALDISDKVVKRMQGFATEYMNGWQRIQTIPDHDHERYMDNGEVYICNLTDVSAVVPPTTAPKPAPKFKF
jgi:hypothetical protein